MAVDVLVKALIGFRMLRHPVILARRQLDFMQRNELLKAAEIDLFAFCGPRAGGCKEQRENRQNLEKPEAEKFHTTAFSCKMM